MVKINKCQDHSQTFFYESVQPKVHTTFPVTFILHLLLVLSPSLLSLLLSVMSLSLLLSNIVLIVQEMIDEGGGLNSVMVLIFLLGVVISSLLSLTSSVMSHPNRTESCSWGRVVVSSVIVIMVMIEVVNVIVFVVTVSRF